MTYKEWCKNELGYECITTYYDDFAIADRFGINAITDTYKRALLNTDYKMMTELSMVLNHRLWSYYEKAQKTTNGQQKKIYMAYAETYDKLWRDCDERCYKIFNKKELSYYYQVTD